MVTQLYQLFFFLGFEYCPATTLAGYMRHPQFKHPVSKKAAA
jgi:hypothetical protein